MIGQSKWSYRPYRPLLVDMGDVYICRVVPTENAIHFEWLDEGDGGYDVFCRVRGDGEFLPVAHTDACFCDITGLHCDTDYEFFVSSGQKKSRVRLARCGKSVGTVVNYLHPDDEYYAHSGRYLCSPSLLRHPDGYLLASMDVFDHYGAQNLVIVFRSDDDGASWHYLCEVTPCFWGKLFLHKGDVYLLGASTEYGDLLIGRSLDGGASFEAPVLLLHGANGKDKTIGVHKNPQPVISFGGRIWNTLEWGRASHTPLPYAAMVCSCAEDDDLLVPENWHFSEPRYPDGIPSKTEKPYSPSAIEGCLTVAPDGRLLNVMRFHGLYQKALVYEVNTSDPDAPLTFDRLMDFPANRSKFEIQRDPVSGDYYSLATRLYDPENLKGQRNLLSLLRSRDLVTWEVVTDLHDYRDKGDRMRIGFQYVDFFFEGDDILYLMRTAINNAHNFHDSNYSTFHRIKHFRSL